MKVVFILVFTIIMFLGFYESPNTSAQNQQNIVNHVSDKVVHVNIVTKNNGFFKYFYLEPPEILIKPGTTVIWTNNDSEVHEVVSGNPYTFNFYQFGNSNSSSTNNKPLFDSDFMAPGNQFQYVFNNPGKYDYHDKEVTNLIGTVYVTH